MAICLFLSNRPFSSTMDLRKQVMTQQSLPAGTDEVDHRGKMSQRFLSVPDIHVSGDAPKDKRATKGSRTKLRVSSSNHDITL